MPCAKIMNPKKRTHGCIKIHFLILTYNLLALRERKNLAQMVNFFYFCLTIDKDIIKVKHYKFTYERAGDMGNDSHESFRNIG